jgi:hypothetical protein
MKVVFIDDARRDLDEILGFISARYPTIRHDSERSSIASASGQKAHRKCSNVPVCARFRSSDIRTNFSIACVQTA